MEPKKSGHLDNLLQSYGQIYFNIFPARYIINWPRQSMGGLIDLFWILAHYMYGNYLASFAPLYPPIFPKNKAHKVK